MFGFDHAELGAHIAVKWHLPVSLERMICHHHDGEAIAALEDSDKRLTALIALTTASLTKLGVGRAEPVEAIDLAQLPAWQILGLPEDAVESTFEIVSEEAKKAERRCSASGHRRHGSRHDSTGSNPRRKQSLPHRQFRSEGCKHDHQRTNHQDQQDNHSHPAPMQGANAFGFEN
jgi:hypothetical protein